MFTLTRLASGLPVLTAPTDGTAAVTVLVFAGAGSRYEIEKTRGISHFLEHMFFKGGKKYKTAAEVSMTIDAIGGDFNAFTGKEYAGYYVKVAAEHAELACDVLSDMLLHARFPDEEIGKERGVIIEEYRMYQDTPMYQAGWDFETLVYGDQPLGWDTIGTEAVIRSVKQGDFMKHKQALYTPDNLVATFAGKIDPGLAERLAKKYFGGIGGTKDGTIAKLKPHAGKHVALTTKGTEQAHLVLGVEGVSALSDDHFAQKILSVILGGSMSSRMFLRIREARGLCYYISTTTDNYLDTGLLSTRAGVDQTRLHEAISAIRHEYELAAKDGITKEELRRAKDFLKGKITLSMEDSEERAHFFGKQQLLYPEVRDLTEYFEKIENVSAEQINKLAARLLKKENLRLVVIGKEKEEKKLEELICD
ncbi:MAG: pitrilysin family protein [Candidatus Peribacteraceae bacterium]|nr:pitrilysin family protein [Candidatus Peribacteraceae bacterium]